MKKALFILHAGILALSASGLKDLVEYASIDGYARGKYIFTEGRDGYGKGYQLFFRPNITTGEIGGFSFTTGLFFAKGSSAPDGNMSDDVIGGSRAFKGDGATDFFNLSNLYVTKKFEAFKTVLQGGVMQINTPLNHSSSWGDRGMGVMATNKSLDGMEFYFSIYDSWMTDNIALQTGAGKTGSGIGNELVIAGVKGDFGILGLKDLTTTLYYAYADKLFNMMLFADLGYKMTVGDVRFEFLGQVASTLMNQQPNFQSGSSVLQTYFTQINQLGAHSELAKTRGLYHFQMGVRIADYYGNLGYAGSFGEGYGAMLDGKGSLRVGGQIWNAVMGGGLMGFGWTGVGSIKNTDIIIAYSTHSYKIGRYKIGLDLAYVGGNNRMPYMKRGSSKIHANDNRGAAVVGKNNQTRNADIFEISPQVSYQVNEKFSINLTYSQLLGDMQLSRTVATLLYNF